MSKEELPMIIPEKKMAIKRQKQRNIEGIKRVGKVVGSFGLAALGVGRSPPEKLSEPLLAAAFLLSANSCSSTIISVVYTLTPSLFV